MNTLNSNLPQGLILIGDALPESSKPATTRAATARKASPELKLPYGMAPVDRKTAFFEGACYWTFLLASAYALVRAFII